MVLVCVGVTFKIPLWVSWANCCDVNTSGFVPLLFLDTFGGGGFVIFGIGIFTFPKSAMFITEGEVI